MWGGKRRNGCGKDMKEEENERRERSRGKVSGDVRERNYMEVEG